jgi:hypothetical protein
MSMFREGPEKGKDGNMIPGPVSARRVLAFILVLAGIALFVAAFWFSGNGWIVFIPGAVCIVASLAFLILTTVNDVQMIVASWKALQGK